MLKKIAALVQGQAHCVLATADGDAPHASLMSFCADQDSREFWLATRRDTRKYRNLAANPRASLLIDDRIVGDRVVGDREAGDRTPGSGPNQALTVTAESRPFATQDDARRARAALLARRPALADFLADPLVEVLRLVATDYQLLTGLTEVLVMEAEKILDAPAAKA